MTIISEFILGCSKNKISKSVVIAPCWYPQSVGINNYTLISDGTCKIWDCYIDDVNFTYIVSGVGAGSCIDAMMSLGYTNCERVLFIGSAGALCKGVNIGDFIIPKGIVSAEGASRYLEEKLSRDVFGKIYYTSEKMHENLYAIVEKNVKGKEVFVYDGVGISVESICLQFKHIDEIVNLNCNCIDMESSAFLAAANFLNLNSAIVFCISDNVMQGEALYLVQNEKTEFRKRVRKEIMPNILKEYINGNV